MASLKKEKQNQTPSFDQYLSFIDMEQHPKWKEGWNKQNQKVFESILHDLGVDLALGWEIDICLHRARTNNKVDYGPRVRFRERTDKWWMNNMMSTSDLVRNTQGSIRSTGMRLSLNEDCSLYSAMKEMAAKYPTEMGIENIEEFKEEWKV